MNLQPLTDTDVDQLDLALGAKVTGARNLDELTADRDLDAFVLFSSIAATWGVLDHGSYAAANAHLDALAQNRRARSLPATSVAWGCGTPGRSPRPRPGWNAHSAWTPNACGARVFVFWNRPGP